MSCTLHHSLATFGNRGISITNQFRGWKYGLKVSKNVSMLSNSAELHINKTHVFNSSAKLHISFETTKQFRGNMKLLWWFTRFLRWHPIEVEPHAFRDFETLLWSLSELYSQWHATRTASQSVFGSLVFHFQMVGTKRFSVYLDATKKLLISSGEQELKVFLFCKHPVSYTLSVDESLRDAFQSARPLSILHSV